MFIGKSIDPQPKETFLIFGGTGSLGHTLVERLLKEDKIVVVFSRDEAKHHKLRLKYPTVMTVLGDVRDYDAVLRAITKFNPKVSKKKPTPNQTMPEKIIKGT